MKRNISNEEQSYTKIQHPSRFAKSHSLKLNSDDIHNVNNKEKNSFSQILSRLSFPLSYYYDFLQEYIIFTYFIFYNHHFKYIEEILPWKSIFTTSLILYILNQKHLLPRHISSIVSKVLFWPTMPLTIVKLCCKVGWFHVIDDSVLLGAPPFGFCLLPYFLQNKYGVKGVINMCEEYPGPLEMYRFLGIEQLYLPTTDHFEPSVGDLKRGIEFIQKYQTERKGSVYVHCRAGHGRSAAIVYSWLLSKEVKSIRENMNNLSDKNHEAIDIDKEIDLKDLNLRLYKIRHVRKKLWKQPNILRYYDILRNVKDKNSVTLDN